MALHSPGHESSLHHRATVVARDCDTQRTSTRSLFRSSDGLRQAPQLSYRRALGTVYSGLGDGRPPFRSSGTALIAMTSRAALGDKHAPVPTRSRIRV